jgi:hypothetical protein
VDKTNIRPQFAAALGSELARLQRRVDGLSQRLNGLCVVSPEPDAADAGLGARVDDLARMLRQHAQDSAATHHRLESLGEELRVLGTAVSTLRQGLAGIAAPLDERLAALAAQMPADPAAMLDAQRAGLEQATRDVQSVSDRVMHLEGRLASAEMMLGSAAADGWQERLAAEQEALQRRVADLGNALETARGEAREQAGRAGRAIEAEQARLKSRMGVGLGLVGVLGLVLLAALGWWAQSELRVAGGRLALLEAETATGDVGQSPLPVSAPNQGVADLRARYAELAERLDRLAERQDESSRGQGQAALAGLGEAQSRLRQQVAEAAARLEQRLDALDVRQAETAGRVARLEALVEAQDGRLTTLESQAEASPSEAASARELPSADSRQPVPDADQPPEEMTAAPSAGAAAPRVLAEERYVVQLIGFRSERSVAPFARRRGIAGEARYRRTSLRGQRWFEVVIGDYATASEAQAALAGLPQELRALDPVVRGLPAGTELLPIE